MFCFIVRALRFGVGVFWVLGLGVFGLRSVFGDLGSCGCGLGSFYMGQNNNGGQNMKLIIFSS